MQSGLKDGGLGSGALLGLTQFPGALVWGFRWFPWDNVGGELGWSRIGRWALRRAGRVGAARFGGGVTERLLCLFAVFVNDCALEVVGDERYLAEFGSEMFRKDFSAAHEIEDIGAGIGFGSSTLG